MTLKGIVAAAAAVLGLGIVTLAGCGGGIGGGGGGGNNNPPAISSFAASPASITAGSSSSLTGVFSNGTGVITPGNISVNSGVATSVSPSTTTTYTLTVSGSGGPTVTSTAVVTVTPGTPTITSFTASPSIITVGGNSSLTAVFSGGTGVVTPGNITVTSGTAIQVSPTTSTTYTLTVSGSGGPTVTSTATVTVVLAPTITSFTANPTTTDPVAGVDLTGDFAEGGPPYGTAIITPGNYQDDDGLPKLVYPTATTTYTLTVTNAAGAAVTATATVTVIPAPVITSFTASPGTINAGQSSNLTSVFSGGTAIVTPGNFPITSGNPLPVSPTSTTTYTITVTDAVNTSVTATTTVTVNAPTITSFTATPTTITAGGSSSLDPVFTGGAGVISGGASPVSVTSGTAVNVSPSATTTYTLTVTPTTGTAITQTVIVTVVPAPVITSFTANPTTILTGNTSALTGVFTGGTGLITPGNYTAISGDSVSVGPASTTTYTLTVKNAAGTTVTSTATVTVTTSTSVTVDPSTPTTIPVANQLLGMNMAVWYDFTANASAVVDAFKGAGIAALRWPGGSTSDDYHWNGSNANPANGVAPSPSTCAGAYQDSSTNYLNFINEFENAIPSGFDVALTADYGSNAACTGGGDPSEAANWVQYAYANGGKVSHVTVGNEEYGSWEEDLHAKKNDPTTYAAAVIGSSGFYDSIKAVNSSVQVGIDVDADNKSGGWDDTIMSNAKGFYDFVEFHYYPQAPGSESDSYLTHQAAQGLTTNINIVKKELAAAGEPNTPIYVGEMGSVYSNPGKQSWSITQGLYAGQMLGEMMNDGVVRATWWIGFGNCNGQAGNDSSSLYGWQTFGAYNVFADAAGEDCDYGGPIGTMSPTAEAFNLFQYVAVNGEYVLTPTVAGDTTDVRAYSATHAGGTALVLFNVNETTPQTVTVMVTGEATSSDVKVITYDKALYDQTNAATPVWALPTTTDMGSQAIPLTLTLTPWSMNVVLIQ